MSGSDSAGSSRSALRTVGEILRWTEERFRKAGLDSPRLDAEILLAKALGVTRLELYTGYHKITEPAERERFRELVLRRLRREPVAHIVGSKEFYSLSFSVNADVLVPRPETEHLVDWALEELSARASDPGRSGELRALDLGTGCGNVAIAIAANRPDCRVDAVDASGAALQVARRNAETHGVADRMTFFQGDWFDAIPKDSRYAVIVSNPPYLTPAELDASMPEVRLCEPRRALVSSEEPGADGLESYRVFASRGLGYLEAGGLFGLEVGAGKADFVQAIFEASGWVFRRKIRDYGGVERVLVFGAR